MIQIAGIAYVNYRQYETGNGGGRTHRVEEAPRAEFPANWLKLYSAWQLISL